MNVFFESSVCCDIEKEVARGIDYKCIIFRAVFMRARRIVSPSSLPYRPRQEALISFYEGTSRCYLCVAVLCPRPLVISSRTRVGYVIDSMFWWRQKP